MFGLNWVCGTEEVKYVKKKMFMDGQKNTIQNVIRKTICSVI